MVNGYLIVSGVYAALSCFCLIVGYRFKKFRSFWESLAASVKKSALIPPLGKSIEQYLLDSKYKTIKREET